MYTGTPSRMNGMSRGEVQGIRRWFTGRHCTDEICCMARVDLPTLDQIIEDDPDVIVIWR